MVFDDKIREIFQLAWMPGDFWNSRVLEKRNSSLSLPTPLNKRPNLGLNDFKRKFIRYNYMNL